MRGPNGVLATLIRDMQAFDRLASAFVEIRSVVELVREK
jgi:hypothetical protein